MGKILVLSWFCSWRALLHPQESPAARGVPGERPMWGEVQTLPGEQAQGTHLEWHHLPRAVPSASPEQSSPGASSRRATSRGYRAQITAGSTLQLLLPVASKGFGSCRALGGAEQHLL